MTEKIMTDIGEKFWYVLPNEIVPTYCYEIIVTPNGVFYKFDIFEGKLSSKDIKKLPLFKDYNLAWDYYEDHKLQLSEVEK